jgi:hypothetical protein
MKFFLALYWAAYPLEKQYIWFGLFWDCLIVNYIVTDKYVQLLYHEIAWNYYITGVTQCVICILEIKHKMVNCGLDIIPVK